MRRNLRPWPDSITNTDVWLVDESEVWRIWCMDCGYRIGTVNAGNDRGAITLTENHRRAMHL